MQMFIAGDLLIAPIVPVDEVLTEGIHRDRIHYLRVKSLSGRGTGGG